MRHSKFILTIIFLGFLLGSFQSGFTQVDNYQKNKTISEEAEAAYNKELAENPYSALPHWKYANVMAEFTFNAYKDARIYYLKALDIDSTNADIYNDFANYLANKLNELDDAKAVCVKGLQFSPDNQKLKDNLKNIERIKDKRDEDIRLFSFNKTDKRYIDHEIAYADIVNLDSINKIVTNKKSEYHYDKLLDNFNKNKPLTDYETYLLLIGFTQTKDYNPYNYNSIDNIYELAANGQIDEAIKKGEEILSINPLNPSLNRVLMYCHRKKGNHEQAELYHNRMMGIFNAMLFTGDGTCEKPYVTFWVKEEYNFARYIGLSPTGQHSTVMCTGGMADKLETYNSQTDDNELIHFNVMPIFKKTMKK